MKNQMITFAVGILLGAVIATGVFLAVRINDSKNISRIDRPDMGENFRNQRDNKMEDGYTNSTDEQDTSSENS